MRIFQAASFPFFKIRAPAIKYSASAAITKTHTVGPEKNEDQKLLLLITFFLSSANDCSTNLFVNYLRSINRPAAQ